MINGRDSQIDRLWLRASITAWIPISGTLTLVCLAKEAQYGEWDAAVAIFPFAVFVGIMWGGVVTLHIVSIPLRIALNLIVRERRWKYCWETIACLGAFAALSWAAYSYFAYPLE